MVNEWQYGDISEFRLHAKLLMRQNFLEISEVLKKWSKDGIAKISHFRDVKAMYSEYYLYRHWDNRPSQYEINYSLESIESKAKLLQSNILSLSAAASRALRRAADIDRQIDFDPDAPCHGWTEIDAREIGDVAADLARLAKWARMALREAPVTSLGKPPRHALLRATRLLAGLYRQLSGLEPYRRANPADGGPEHGQFRKFINEFMALVGAKVNDATVREAKRLAMAENEKGGAR